MPRGKSSFVCRDCGYVSPGPLGQCAGCGRWNTIAGAAPRVSAFPRKAGGATSAPVLVRLAEVDAGAHTRIDTGLGVKGESVLKYAPDSQAAKAYRQLAREVLNGKKI